MTSYEETKTQENKNPPKWFFDDEDPELTPERWWERRNTNENSGC